MRIGIIGAGAAGLTAAFTLGKAGHQATVYEADPFLGGQASTFDVGGGRLEKGYHHLFTSDTDILDLISELGLEHKMAWIESRVGIFYDGKIYNFVTPGDLLRFTPLSLIDRFRMGLVTLYLQRYKDWRKLEQTRHTLPGIRAAFQGAEDALKALEHHLQALETERAALEESLSALPGLKKQTAEVRAQCQQLEKEREESQPRLGELRKLSRKRKEVAYEQLSTPRQIQI